MALALALGAGLAALGAAPAAVARPPASAASLTVERAATWDEAAARLGVAGSLWEPTRTDGLEPVGPLQVRAGGVRITADGSVAAGRMRVEAQYGTTARGFRVWQKWAQARWAKPPVRSRTLGRVGRDTVLVGPSGAQVRVPVTVYANCLARPVALRPEQVPLDETCSRADVARGGGVLTMTARPGSDRAAPGDTSVVIASSGLSYRELLTLAASLEQVAGAPAGGAGSAQMVGMCRQMVAGAMTAGQADSFAAASGYLTRVGTIDGVPQAVTADYRPDRFTLATLDGRVVSCTYG